MPIYIKVIGTFADNKIEIDANFNVLIFTYTVTFEGKHMKNFPGWPASGFFRVAALFLCTVLISHSSLAQKASLGQQVAVMKALKPDLKVIGIISNNISDKLTADVTRAGLSQGVTIVIAKAKDPRDVSSLYKKLVSEKKIQMLWVPDPSDDVVMGIGMDYLRENTAMDAAVNQALREARKQ